MVNNNFNYINNDNSIELCTDWGWYVDLDSTNNRNYFNANFNIKNQRKSVCSFIQVNQQNEVEYNEYDFYTKQFENTQENIKRIPTYLEINKEEEYKTKKNIYSTKNIIKITSATLITGLMTYFILTF